MTNIDKDTARDQAIAQMASVAEMVAALDVDYDRLQELRESHNASDDDAEPMTDEDRAELADLESAAGDCTDADDARQRIEEDALSVEVRSDWASPGEALTAGEYRIVLCTGGPHVEIVGDLNRGEPDSVRCIYKDWGTSGELFDFDHDAALTYARCFFFGE